MNNILQLKGQFIKRGMKPGKVVPKIPQGQEISSAHIINLVEDLKNIAKFWNENKEINGALVSAYHTRVMAKSNRLKVLLSKNSDSPSKKIRGAKLKKSINNKNRITVKHIFTYYVSIEDIVTTIKLLEEVSKYVDLGFEGVVCADKWEIHNFSDVPGVLSKTKILNVLLDCMYLEKFDIEEIKINPEDNRIITIYETSVETKDLLKKFGIRIFDSHIINKTTINLDVNQARMLEEKAPYLIAMNVSDFSKIDIENISRVYTDSQITLPSPKNEPIIGVIDTHFDKNVYFSEWVEYINLIDDNIEIHKEDYIHGTAVSSIIVDGPRGNPKLDDGCGRFRVRHFGIATQLGFSSFTFLRKIREIVSTNIDIKVWNLSLGSKTEISDNFISPEAAELDKIQTEYDIVFVVAGTNKPKGKEEDMKIGSPADSLNSVVVNSVAFSGKPASYSRKGPVLSFFAKPDVSYYGGDGTYTTDKLAVCINNNLGAQYVQGTSFSAPWISRKLAYMINVLGLSREIAKALLIDAAAGWDRKDDNSNIMGYGIVPVKIEDIISSKNDEIKFVMSGCADEYETFTYNLPVPMVNNKYPFFAKATMVYFPYCERMQGVDYTSTELDIHFGRVDNKGKIKTINNNTQGEDGNGFVYEEDARKFYRKWDNVKHISEKINKKSRPRDSYEGKIWGISIKSKERLSSKHIHSTQFGLVITLKEMYGKNRIDDFIKMCMTRSWLVNEININNQIEVYNKSQGDIEFSD